MTRGPGLGTHLDLLPCFHIVDEDAIIGSARGQIFAARIDSPNGCIVCVHGKRLMQRVIVLICLEVKNKQW